MKVDAFHRGRFVLAQPRHGHRSGMDALVLASAVPADFAGTVADLGAGAGAVALAVLARCPKAQALLVENSPEMLDFARRTLAHPDNAGLAGRARPVAADVTLAGAARAKAGLAERCADFVLMNPPFNDRRDRMTPQPLRHSAHVMADGLLEAWLRTAAAVARPGAGLGAIVRPAALKALLDALENRFGSAVVVPVHARAERAAIRIVLRAWRGRRGSLALAPPLVLQEADGRATARADALANGLACLFED